MFATWDDLNHGTGTDELPIKKFKSLGPITEVEQEE
jgi:hypothetical protein